ncbi:MAG TPA: hypothetical protein VIX20_17885 [Ktedonobacteraceae bacterium]
MTITESQLQDEPQLTPEEERIKAEVLQRIQEKIDRIEQESGSSLYSIISKIFAPDIDIFEGQAAIAAIQQSDPTDFKAISGSKLTLSNSFYNNTLRQSQQSFLWSLIWAGVGAIFIIVSVLLVILLRPTIANSVIIGLLGGTGGIGSETIAYATLQLYKQASDHAAACHIRLDSASDFILANSACEGLDGPEKQQMRSEIIRKLVE